MILDQIVPAYATTFALSAARVGGFVLIAPLPGEQAPAMARLGLALVLAVLVTPIVTIPGSVPELSLALAVPVIAEVGVGLLVGLAFRFVLSAAEVLGNALSQAVGLGMPSLFNPAIGEHDTPIAQVISLFAMLFAVSVGAHRVALAYLLESFRALPVGASVHLSRAAPVFVELGGQSIAVGVRLAMPVVAVAVAVQLALALLARAAPSMQLFSVGFTILILAGFATILASAEAIGVGLLTHLGVLGDALDRLLWRLSPWG